MMCHEGGYSAFGAPFLALAIIEELSGVKPGVVDPLSPLAASVLANAIGGREA